ncbi:type 1 fimbrial protein [Salmonella enterica subsp. enterica]|nr:type 1 fimbrial protein [Salmonella enterica subsp. enterica]
MKIKNRLFVLGAAMAVMSSSAFAATTGTQTFTAKVTADTCTIANLNQAIDLGTINKAEFAKITGSNWQFALGHGVDTTFEVTGCPATITTVKATPTFSGSDSYVDNAGTSTNTVLHMGRKKDGTQLPANDIWNQGVERDFTVSNAGSASIPVYGLVSIRDSSAVPVVGTLQYNVTFAFDFV